MLSDMSRRNQGMIRTVFVLSALAMTFIMTLNYSVFIEYDGYIGSDYVILLPAAFLAAAIMIPVYIYIANRRKVIDSALRKQSHLSIVFCAVLTLIIILQLIFDVQKNYYHLLDTLNQLIHNDFLERKGYKIILLGLCLSASIAIYVFISYVSKLVVDFSKDFLAEVDTFERYYFVITSLACCSLICYVFARTTATWNSLDLVYQTDAVFVTKHYFPVFSFGYDFDWDIGNGGIRHPLTTLLTYPIHVLCWGVANLLSFIPNVLPLLYAIVLAELLVITAITLKRIADSYWAAVLFSFSFPFVLFTIFVEKYQIAVILVVLFVYSVLRRKDNQTQMYFLVAGGGMMITSAFMGFFYGRERKIWRRIKEYISAGLVFMGALVATGRINYILSFVYLKNQNFKMFYNDGVSVCTFFQRIAGFTNLIASSFIPVAYQANEKNFYWTDLSGKINICGAAVCVFMLITLIMKIREKRMWMCIHWLMLAVIEWIIMGMNIGAGPLFSLYFSWAVIVLVVLGVNTIIKKDWHRALVYLPMIMVMFYTNVVHMKELLDFMILHYPA